MRNIFLFLTATFMLLGMNTVMSQSKDTQTIKTNQEAYSFVDLMDLIKNQTKLNCTYKCRTWEEKNLLG